MNSILTTCPYCGTGCTYFLNVEGGEIVSITPNDKNTVNDGKLCAKGRFGFDFITHKDRLTSPMVRKEGKLVEVTWEEAINFIVSKIKKTVKETGADSVAAFSSARCSNEENYLMQKLMRMIGTNNVDHCARL